MFDSVLEENIPRRRLGRGAMMSFAVTRPAARAGDLRLLAPEGRSRETAGRDVLQSGSAATATSAPSSGGRQAKETEDGAQEDREEARHRRADDEASRRSHRTPRPLRSTEGQVGGVVGGVAGGVVGGTVGGTVGGVIGGTVGGTGTQVIPFGAGMDRSRRSSRSPTCEPRRKPVPRCT